MVDPSGLVPLGNVVGRLLKSHPFLFPRRLPLLARQRRARRGKRRGKRNSEWLAALAY